METQSQSAQLQEFWKRVIATLNIEVGLSNGLYIFYTGDNTSLSKATVHKKIFF